MFRGLFEHSMDPKGRTSMPQPLREALQQREGDADSVNRLIVTTGIDRCLVAYPVSEWAAFEARLASLSQFDPAVVQLRRIYVAGATDCSLDRHGRLLIPPMLREYAELDHEIVWAGMVTTVEIWSKKLWMEQMAASRNDRQSIAKALGSLGL